MGNRSAASPAGVARRAGPRGQCRGRGAAPVPGAAGVAGWPRSRPRPWGGGPGRLGRDARFLGGVTCPRGHTPVTQLKAKRRETAGVPRPVPPRQAAPSALSGAASVTAASAGEGASPGAEAQGAWEPRQPRQSASPRGRVGPPGSRHSTRAARRPLRGRTRGGQEPACGGGNASLRTRPQVTRRAPPSLPLQPRLVVGLRSRPRGHDPLSRSLCPPRPTFS